MKKTLLALALSSAPFVAHAAETYSNPGQYDPGYDAWCRNATPANDPTCVAQNQFHSGPPDIGAAETLNPEAVALTNQYQRVFNDKDVRGFKQLYATDGVLLFQTGQTLHLPEIQKTYADVFQHRGPRVTITLDETHINSAGGWAIGHAIQDYKDHQTPVHFLAVYTRENGDLKVQALSVGANVPTPYSAPKTN